MRVKFNVLEQTKCLHLPAKFHLNVFIVSAAGGQKPQFWANFDTFGGSCTDEGQTWCVIANLRRTLTCQISSRSIYSVALWRQNSQFLPYFRLRHLVVSPAGSNLRKLSTGAQLQTLPYPTVSKSFLYYNDFMAKSAHKLWRSKSWRTDKQTNRQKTQHFWPPRRRVKSEPHQTWHVDRGPRARSCIFITFGNLMHSFAARGALKIWG